MASETSNSQVIGKLKDADAPASEAENNSSSCKRSSADSQSLTRQVGLLEEDNLLEVFANNELPSIVELIKEKGLHTPSRDPNSNYITPLHIAAQVCTYDVTLKLVKEVFPQPSCVWINVRDPTNKRTPLHIAADKNLYDIVKLYLSISGANDSIRDANMHVPSDLCSDSETASLFRDSRYFFVTEIVEFMRKKLKSATGSQDILARYKLDMKMRSYFECGWLDINHPIEDDTDQTILHIAARNQDKDLLDWALSIGADVNTKDNKGKRPIDLVPKTNNQLREILIQGSSVKQKLISGNHAVGEFVDNPVFGVTEKLPTIKDTILKWVNYASGFKPRYLVLKNGTLSYYRGIEDYPRVCKGSVNVLDCNVKINMRDPTRMDIFLCDSNKPYLCLQARNHAFAKKWFWAITKSQMLMKKKLGNSTSGRDPETINSGSNNLTQDTSSGFNFNDKQNKPSGLSKGQISLDCKFNMDDLVNRVSSLKEGCSGFDSKKESMESDITSWIQKLDAYSAKLSVLGTKIRVDKLMSPNPELKDSLEEYKCEVEKMTEAVKAFSDFITTKFLQFANLSPSIMAIIDELDECIEKMLVLPNNRESFNSTERQTTPSGGSYSNNDELGATGPLEKIENGDSQCSHSCDEVFYDALDSYASAEPMPPLASGGNGSSANFISQSGGKAKKLETQKQFSRKHPFAPPTKEDMMGSIMGYDGISNNPRTSLALDPTRPKPSLQIWSFIKSAIGKDLSRIALPVLFNEPLSTLQRLCEDITYVELLSLASRVGCGMEDTNRPTDEIARKYAGEMGLNYNDMLHLKGEASAAVRCALVSVFAMSGYSSTNRISKPFNPLLGETYEFADTRKCFRYISEQVCHHPPISASHCESPDYCLTTEANMKSKFYGKSFEITPAGYTYMVLSMPKTDWPEYNKNVEDVCLMNGALNSAKESGVSPYKPEMYSWTKASTRVTNFILGKLKLESRGSVNVKCHSTGMFGTVRFLRPKSNGWLYDWGQGSSKNGIEQKNKEITVSGEVKGENGEIYCRILGNHFSSVTVIPGEALVDKLPDSLKGNFQVWAASPIPKNSHDYYDFTRLAMFLNECPGELLDVLPESDSRVRPDQFSMEIGDWDEASNYKQKLEDIQRITRARLIEQYKIQGSPDTRSDYDSIVESIPRNAHAEHPGESWWRPRWFIYCYDNLNKANYWRFIGDYWSIRSRISSDEFKENWPEWSPRIFNKDSFRSIAHKGSQ